MKFSHFPLAWWCLGQQFSSWNVSPAFCRFAFWPRASATSRIWTITETTATLIRIKSWRTNRFIINTNINFIFPYHLFSFQFSCCSLFWFSERLLSLSFILVAVNVRRVSNHKNNFSVQKEHLEHFARSAFIEKVQKSKAAKRRQTKTETRRSKKKQWIRWNENAAKRPQSKYTEEESFEVRTKELMKIKNPNQRQIIAHRK